MAMKPTFHIIGKDLRDLRLLLPLAGWWIVSVLQPLLISVSPRLPSSPPAIEMMSGVFLGGLAWLLAALDLGLLVLIVSQLVQRDSTVGATAFWLSRPISGARLLAGKSLFLLLAVILPTVAVQFLMLLFNGVTLYDAVRSAPQIFVLQMLVLSALMMLACLTPNLSRMLFLGVIAAVGLAIVQYTLRLSSPPKWLGQIPGRFGCHWIFPVSSGGSRSGSLPSVSDPADQAKLDRWPLRFFPDCFYS